MISRLLVLSLFLVASDRLLQADPVEGQVKSISGNALYISPGGRSETLTTGTGLRPGGRIHTGENASVVIEWCPGAFSVIGGDSNVGISTLDYTKSMDEAAKRQIALRLLKGSLFFHVAHHDGTSDFRVNTPEGVAAARGTDGFVTMRGSSVSVVSLADTVEIILPSGRGIALGPGYASGLPDGHPYVLAQNQVDFILAFLRSVGFTITGNAAHGYTIFYIPAHGEGFQFSFNPYVHGAIPPGELPPHGFYNGPISEPPIPRHSFPYAPPTSQ